MLRARIGAEVIVGVANGRVGRDAMAGILLVGSGETQYAVLG